MAPVPVEREEVHAARCWSRAASTAWTTTEQSSAAGVRYSIGIEVSGRPPDAAEGGG